MTMRLDIVSNDAGEMVRREHARELGAGVLVAIYRLVKLAQMHNLQNQAFVQQLDQTHQIIGEYALRSGGNVNIFFSQRAVFVAGQLLKGSRQTYEHAQDLADICEWLGGSEIVVMRDITREELHAFAEAVSAAMRSERGNFQSPTPRIRIRAVADAARLRGLEIEDLSQEQRIIRTYASAVVILRRFFEDLHGSKYILPRRIKRVAQNLVDLSEGNNAAFLGVTEARNANYDEAGRAVNSAILAVTVARQVTQDRTVLSQIAMASMMHDVARPRALAISAAAMASMGGGMGGMGAMAPTLSEEQEDRLAAGAAAVLTALGRVNEPSITRTVVAFEALWLRRQQWLGTIYRGVRAPTIHARIMWIARRFNDLMTPEPGLPPPTADFGIAQLAEELADPQDKTVLRMLVAAIGVIPLGTVVQLSTGEAGEVTRGTVSADDKPLVRISLDANGGMLAKPIEIDLAKQPPGQPVRTVVRVLSIDGWKKAIEARRALEPQAQDGHGAMDYDEAPQPWESQKPPPPPAASSAPAPRLTSPIPAPEINADAFTVPPAAPSAPPPMPVSLFPPLPSEPPQTLNPSPSVPIEADEDDDSSGDPISNSGVSASLGTSPSMVGMRMGEWEGVPPPAPLPHDLPRSSGGMNGGVSDDEQRTIMQASGIDSPIVERSASIRPEPTARGDLASTPLAHVLVYMLDHTLSGSVVFSDPDGSEHIVYFHRGVPAKVKLGYEYARLGELLARAGVFEESQIDHYVEGARRLGVVLGEYLVGHDVVPRDTLEWVLETQVLEKVSSLANLAPETTYGYYRDTNLLETWGGDLALSSPLNSILAVVRAWHDRARIRATLNRIGKHPLVFHEESDSSGLILSDEEQAIIETMRGEKIQLADLFRRNLADEEVVSAIVYTMAVTRQFAFKGQKKGPMATAQPPKQRAESSSSRNIPAAAPARSAPARPAAAAPAPAPSAPQIPSSKPNVKPQPKAPAPAPQPVIAAMPKLGGPSVRPVVKGTIQGLQPKALGSLMGGAPAPTNAGGGANHTGGPVVRPAISKIPAAQPIAKNPGSNAKIPIAAPLKSPAAQAPGPAAPIAKGPADRASQSKVSVSPNNKAPLKPGAPQIRPIAGGSVAKLQASAPAAGANSATNASSGPASQRIPIAASPPKDAAARPVMRPSAKLPTSAPSGATPAAPPVKPIQAAPAGALKDPKRISGANPAPAPLRPPMPSSPKIAPPPPPSSPSPKAPPSSRPGADAEDGTLALDGGMAEAEAALEAMTNFRLADTALARSDLAGAERLGQMAVDADPSQAEYRALLAWVKAMRANNNAAFEQAITTMTELIDEDPSSERASLYRGRLYKKLGNVDKALADFRNVLDLDPSNREAQGEIRTLKKK